MTLTELKDHLMTITFQYFIGKDNIEVSETVLKDLSKRALSVYGTYRPIEYFAEIQIQEKNQIFSEIDGRRIRNIQQLYMTNPHGLFQSLPVIFPWKFIKSLNTLRTNLTGSYYAKYLVSPLLEDIFIENYEYIDLCKGLFLMYVGSSRKSFSLTEMPVSNDGSELFQYGREIFEKAEETLKNTESSWYLWADM